ncbi:PREDICTED: traB domain-containing protein-like isoform X1 [Lupinus angustifolius]|uniref:traB domain-containing protein-like isoform X1 n=1 Tax=Lupinus angustifolius TaxID=3871 RepID=UPI00092E9D66|nr:PREDICTED: traB domain-containing protein-like isoform X1 [Lupinus angustifolius]
MTQLVTRFQLARVTVTTTPFIHRSNPKPASFKLSPPLSQTLAFPQFSSKTTAPSATFRRTIRPAMDAQPQESATPPVESKEDFIHVDDLKMENLSDSLVRIDNDSSNDEPSESASENEASDRLPVTLPEELSRNVLVLSCESSAEGGVCDVYLVGTAHVSEESSREVQAIVNHLKPEVVFLELCSSRVAVLTLQNLKVPTAGEMIAMLKKKHNLFEVLYGWFLAKIASQLEVFPGSEFRVAYEEAMKYGGRVILGDRPVQVTLRRTWSKMPLWHKTKLVYSLLFQAVFLPSSDDLNKMLKEMDDSDMLTLVIQEMSKEFPTLMETVVHERDQYMSSTLLKVASENSLVVGVVGKGHLQGIKKHWKQPIVMKDLMTVPSPKPAFSAIKIFTSVGVAVAGVAIISGIYISCKK